MQPIWSAIILYIPHFPCKTSANQIQILPRRFRLAVGHCEELEDLSFDPPTMLKGKWCLVTGGGRGIGEAIAVAFAKEGAKLILVSRTVTELDRVAEKCLAAGAGVVETRSVDLSDLAATEALAAEVLEKHGKVDVLVNNAAIADGKKMSALGGDPDFYEKAVAVNLSAPMRLTRRLAPKMAENKWGVIINVSSVSGTVPTDVLACYAATKHGLNGWSHSCARELRPYNVKVVCIQPGWVATEMARGAVDLNRAMTPDDVAEACMLTFRVSSRCYPEDVVLYPATSAQ